jgi:hypothetical protein
MAVLLGASVVAVGVLHGAGGVSGRAGSVLAGADWKVASAAAEPALAGQVGAAIATAPAPRIAPRDAAVDRGRWRAIVIHDSGTPAGDLRSIERRHQQAGLAGLGFHFVVGNGQGMDDGAIAVGPRWERQLAGAHAARGWRTPPGAGTSASLDAAALNQSAIAVCLVGRADRRPFTDRQCREARALVRRLQEEFAIPDGAVFMSCELRNDRTPAPEPWGALRHALMP